MSENSTLCMFTSLQDCLDGGHAGAHGSDPMGPAMPEESIYMEVCCKREKESVSSSAVSASVSYASKAANSAASVSERVPVGSSQRVIAEAKIVCCGCESEG